MEVGEGTFVIRPEVCGLEVEVARLEGLFRDLADACRTYLDGGVSDPRQREDDE